MPSRQPAVGVVAEFDADRGLGTVDVDGATALPFHCTAIADGSRRVPEGARVTFATSPTHLGSLEAIGVRVVTLSAGSSGTSG